MGSMRTKHRREFADDNQHIPDNTNPILRPYDEWDNQSPVMIVTRLPQQ